MAAADTRSRIAALLNENFSIDTAKVTEEATFRGTLGMDSLDVVDFIFFVQQEFGFKAKTAEFRTLDTVADLVAFVEAKTA